MNTIKVLKFLIFRVRQTVLWIRIQEILVPKVRPAVPQDAPAEACIKYHNLIRWPMYYINRGSYMSAHLLLNLLKELRKKIKCEACRAFYLFFATS